MRGHEGSRSKLLYLHGYIQVVVVGVKHRDIGYPCEIIRTGVQSGCEKYTWTGEKGVEFRCRKSTAINRQERAGAKFGNENYRDMHAWIHTKFR